VEVDLEAAMGRPQKVRLTAFRLCLLSTWKTSCVKGLYVHGLWILVGLFINPNRMRSIPII
jgi:hypothetical protein